MGFKAAIITIGDEILIGQVIDTNSAFIAKQLEGRGFEVLSIWSIKDTEEEIKTALVFFQNKVDVVVLTGGLGPTQDDVTKATLASYFEDQLEVNEEVLQHVVQMMEKVYKRPVSQINKNQALVLSKAQILFNTYGTAPGMWVQNDKTTFVALPGVPFEMENIVTTQLLPKLEKHFQESFVVHKTIVTQGIGESLLAEYIQEWENALPQNIKLAYLPSPGVVKLRLTARGENKKKLLNEVESQVEDIKKYILPYIIGLEEGEDAETMVFRKLKDKGKTISFAESCTGGLLASKFTKLSGASSVFIGSVVTYATHTKIKELGVSKDVIDRYSVVSEEVVLEMVRGVQAKFSTDYAIATTGNAGPSKGDSDEEVGTVCIGIAILDEIKTYKFHFGQPREKVVEQACKKSFELLLKELGE